MAIGFSYTFGLERQLLSAVLRAHQGRPGLSVSDLGVETGLNTKKATAYNAWLLYLGLRDGNSRHLSSLGQLLCRHDPHLEDELSLQLLHYQLCSNSNATVWWNLCNHVIPEKRDLSITEALQHLIRMGFGGSNERNLRADARIFFAAYETGHIFERLGYVRKLGGERYGAASVTVRIPLLAFILYHRRETGLRTSTASIESIRLGEGHVGNVFLLDREGLSRALRELEYEGKISVARTADLDNISYTYDGQAIDLLKAYYEKVR